MGRNRILIMCAETRKLVNFSDPPVKEVWEPEIIDCDLKSLYYSEKDYKMFQLEYNCFLIYKAKRLNEQKINRQVYNKQDNLFGLFYIFSLTLWKESEAFRSFIFRNTLSFASRQVSSMSKTLNHMSEDIGESLKLNFDSYNYVDFYEFLYLY